MKKGVCEKEKITHGPSGMFTCLECNKSFEQKRYLNMHVKTHDLRENTKFKCSFCDKMYSNTTNLTVHMKTIHQQSKEAPKFIHFQTSSFLMVASPPKPTLVQHSARTVQHIKCDECGYTGRSNNVTRHIETQHIQKKEEITEATKVQHSCDLCDYTGRIDNVKRHIETQHELAPKLRDRGRKRMAPENWSVETKRIYAKQIRNEFQTFIGELGLIDEIEKLLENDSKNYNKVSKVTENHIINMISDFDLSDRKMLKILKRMKEMFGERAFSNGIRDALITRKEKLIKYFKCEEFEFESGNGETMKRHMAYTEKLDNLLDFICFERDLVRSEAEIKI